MTLSTYRVKGQSCDLSFCIRAWRSFDHIKTCGAPWYTTPTLA